MAYFLDLWPILMKYIAFCRKFSEFSQNVQGGANVLGKNVLKTRCLEILGILPRVVDGPSGMSKEDSGGSHTQLPAAYAHATGRHGDVGNVGPRTRGGGRNRGRGNRSSSTAAGVFTSERVVGSGASKGQAKGKGRSGT